MIKTSEDIEKATPMDEHLKVTAVEKLKLAIDFAIQGKDVECFRAYKSMFHLIEPYDFDLKEELREITESISEHIFSLQGRPLNKRAEIIINEQKRSLRELLQIYMSQIPKAYAELGLWFKVIKYSDDLDKKISNENFNSELTMVERKKKRLEELDTKKLISLMRPNSIHQCYAKLIIEDVI